MNLSFKATLFGDGARGARMQIHTCVEHPRLTQLAQKASHDAPWVTTFHVDGIANHFETIADALKAMEANPAPANAPIVQTPEIAAAQAAPHSKT